MPAVKALVVEKQDPNKLSYAACGFLVYFNLLMYLELMLEIVSKFRLKHWRVNSLLFPLQKNPKSWRFSNIRFLKGTGQNNSLKLLKFHKNSADDHLNKQNFCRYEKYILRLIHFFQYI